MAAWLAARSLVEAFAPDRALRAITSTRLATWLEAAPRDLLGAASRWALWA